MSPGGRTLTLVCAVLGWVATAHAGPPPHAGSAPLAYAPAPVDNPLKGFVPYDTAAQRDEFPHSLEWFYLPLSALMPAERVFDWQPLEQRLNAIAARRCQAVFRVYLDYPGQPPGTPRFLLAEGLEVHRYDGRKNHGRSVSPDYEDPRLRSVLREFIAALGARYDGDPRIGFITAGLLGYWGEWHTSDHKEWFASERVQQEVMDAYDRAFHKTAVLLRYPAGPDDAYYADNHSRRFGYHDDSFAWATMPSGKPNSWFFLDRMKRAGALEKWRTEPIGGEVRPEVWNTLWDEPTGAPAGQEFLPCVNATHATWLMNSGVFRTGLSGERRDRALAGARKLGYELTVRSATAVVQTGNLVRIVVRIENTGVAPFYYRWPVFAAVLTPNGSPIASWITGWDLTGILPPDAEDFSSVHALPSDLHGEFRIALRVPNPLPQGRPMRFANVASQDSGWLTIATLRR
ncbi:MAG TPA: hypothetical protein VHE61_15000 [Opitutaceae bacterium]|nr:hypothetical protein [Opitutaceae bacterium]